MSATLAGWFDRAPRAFRIIQDGRENTAGNLKNTGAALAARLPKGGRAAFFLSSASETAAALFACETAGCEAALLRGGPAGRNALISELRAGAVVTQGLEVEKRSDGSPAAAGFAVLIPTAGTTGRPKVAVHDLDALASRVDAEDRGRGRATWLLTYHPATFAGVQMLLTVMAGGDDLVAVSKDSAAELARAATDSAVTHVSGTPTFWRSLLMTLGRAGRTAPLARITLGGEAADQKILDDLRARFPDAAIRHIYAATETGALFSVKDGRAGFPAAWLETGIEGVGLRVRDGVLEVSSPRRMRGYALYAQGKAHPTGDWIPTGDRVRIEGDRILFAGRTDGTINVGGAKADPEEVEARLRDVPGVAEIRIYGAPSPITGAIVAAEVVPGPGVAAEALREALEKRARESLAPHEIPRAYDFVERVAVGAAGKKLRGEREDAS